MYHPVPEQTNSQPDQVADGTFFDTTQASKLGWIALSRDLHQRWGGPLRFGDIVYVHIPQDYLGKSGFYQVKDIMNQRFTKRIDILETPGTAIYSYAYARLYKVTAPFNSEQLLTYRDSGVLQSPYD